MKRITWWLSEQSIDLTHFDRQESVVIMSLSFMKHTPHAFMSTCTLKIIVVSQTVQVVRITGQAPTG